MLGRSINWCLLVTVLLAVAGGCKKSEPEQKSASQSPQSQAQPYTNAAPGELIARIHWLGKKRIAADANAANFMGIWNLPESQKLETQTLDKLALAPWNLPRGDTNLSAIIATNTSSALLRPLLDDLLQEESYLEIRQTTNQPAQTVLAIHLDDQRAALWNTNIATLSQTLFTQHPPFINATVNRTAQWTLLGLADKQNALLTDFTARIQQNGTPFAASLTNYWIDAQLDLKRLVTLAFASTETAATPTGNTNVGLTWPTNINFTFIGDGQQVVTRAEADFSQPLPIELEPWNIPTNLIHDPLISFSAIRGFRSFLKSFKPWNDLQLGTPPNQAVAWAQHGTPWMHFVAIPSAEASNEIDRLADFVVNELNPMIAPSRLGAFEKVPGTHHLKWHGISVFFPDLNLTNLDGNPYVLAGFSDRALTNKPAPPELFSQFINSTNLVWYDWEFSMDSLKGWTPINQLLRHMFTLPRFDVDDVAWLLNIAKQAGNCVSALKLESQTQLVFSRQSTMGFTGLELPIVLDWLESPKFPYGLHTFLAPPPPPFVPPTNSVSRPTPQPATNTAAEPKKP